MAFCNGCKHSDFLGMKCQNIVYISYLAEEGKLPPQVGWLDEVYSFHVNRYGRCPAWERPWWAFWRKPLEPVPENPALDDAEKIIKEAQ